MTTTPHRRRSLLLGLIGIGALCGLASAIARSGGGSILRLKDGTPARRAVFFRVARDPRLASLDADPRTLGAVLQIVGLDPGDGNSGAIVLAGERWRGLGKPAGSKGYRYRDRASTNGITKVLLRRGARGGMLIISGRGASWAYAIEKPQGRIEVRFAIGEQLYCAGFTRYARNVARKVVVRDGAPPAACSTAPTDFCGDHAVDGTEECDDGNSASGDGCSADCVRESTRCGDGVTGTDEECDDGNETPGDGCSTGCQLESTDAICAGVGTVTTNRLATALVATGLDSPTTITAPPLDPHRLFVVEQIGRIRIVKDGTLLPTPFLTIQSKVVKAGERGLLGLAFHPDYESNGLFYVYYTRTGDGTIVVARYQVTADPDVADPDSEHVILTVPHPVENHDGGQLAFGPDGRLYLSPGDGGGGCDPGDNSQDDASRLGKLLRVNVDVMPETIEQWAKGLRNAWRFSFDRGTGDLYIADVGQDAWEEIDYDPAPVEAGANYGWNFQEGTHCAGCGEPCSTPSGYVPPIHEYAHVGSGCSGSITGGYVYRGCRMPAVHGTYLFAEYCRNLIQSLVVDDGEARNVTDLSVELRAPDGTTIERVSSFGEDARGELYIAAYRAGKIFRIIPGR